MEASEDGRYLTGNVKGDIVDGARKKHLLETIAKMNNISLDQVPSRESWLTRTVAVGDGANDLMMLNRASLGVAYNGKAKLQERAPRTLSI
jgi:phosphoserine phosphatase